MRRAILLALIIATFTTGCGWFRLKVGSPPDPNEVERIIPGETSRRHVEETLGAPDAVARLAEGDVYLYRYDEGKMNFLLLLLFNWGSLDVKPDRLLIIFDDAGMVKNVAWRHASDTAEFRFLP